MNVARLFPVRVVSRRTGLSPHVLRVWERRYGAVAPQRSSGNRRLYSEIELQRLETLASLTRAGHAISQISGLSTADLEALLHEEQQKVLSYSGNARSYLTKAGAEPAEFLSAAFNAVSALDIGGLEESFDRAALALGYSGLIEQVMAPLIEQIGSAWSAGKIAAAHEHAASSLIKDYLARSAPPYGDPAGPGVVVATPAGQLHELGAVLCAAVARKCGWRVTYLGPSLPAAEIAGAALHHGVALVALSIVFPHNDPQLPGQIERLRRLLPEEITLVAGGRAAPAYQQALEAAGARIMPDLTAFRDLLTQNPVPRRAP